MLGSSCNSFWCQGAWFFSAFAGLIVLYIYMVTHDNGAHRPRTSSSSSLSPKANAEIDIPTQLLQDTLATIKASKARIWTTWEVDSYPHFLGLTHVPSASWDMQKAKFVQLLLEGQQQQMQMRVHDTKSHHKKKEEPITASRRKWVVGFSGSSVTAGHDSYFSEAFPSVFNDTLRAVFGKHPQLGIDLEVRNHAFGNNPCTPYSHCLETHLGADLDLLAWEQSMNCGHDPRPVESFLRAALRMPRRPPVLFLSSGTPYWQPSDCANKSSLYQQPYVPTDAERLLLKTPLQKAADELRILENMTFLDIKTRSSGTLSLSKLYQAAAPMGQNLAALEAYKCRGPYGYNFSMKTPGGGSTWHPGRLGHQLRGENLAYVVLTMLEDALRLLLSKGSKQAAAEARATLESAAGVLPERPIVCSPEECDSPSSCFTDFTPRMQNSLSSILVGGSVAALKPSNWTLDVSFLDRPAILKAEAKGLGYLDRKYIFTSGSVHKPLTIHISPRRPGKGFILICEVQKGFAKYPSWMGDLDKAAAVVLFEDALDAQGNKLHWQRGDEDKKRANMVHLALTHHADQCYRTEPIVGPGNHVLAIMQRTEGVRINVAYVVYW